MANVSIARRYARALLEVATDGGRVDKVLTSLEEFSQALKGHPEFREFVENPAYTRAQRWTVVEKVAATLEAKDPAVDNLLRLLVDRNRVGLVTDITRVYRDLADQSAGRLRGLVTSAKPLPPESVRKIEESLERITQRNVVLSTQVDPQLLGGVSAQVGSFVYDGSLKNQLQQLRESLKVR